MELACECASGGQTSVVTAPGLAATLLGHGIVPLATLPGTEGAATGKSGIAVKFTFPVTGGSVNLKQLTGTIGHSGGILFIAPATGKKITVSDFVINLKQKVLTAVGGRRNLPTDGHEEVPGGGQPGHGL